MKKITQWVVGFFLCLVFLTQVALPGYATEQSNIPSQGNVGFYGSYEAPNQSTTETTNENAQVPDSPSGKPSYTLDEDRHGTSFLPHTGEERASYTVIMGGGLVFLAFLLIINKKKKEEQ